MKTMKTMKTIAQLITPEQAAEWLRPTVNRDNRPLRQDHVAYLAREICDGRWQATHQGIAFSSTGRLLDGQHRLAAIVSAGKSVTMAVTTGLDDEAFSAIDCGLKRASYDRIHMVDDQRQNKLICTAIRAYLSEVSHGGAISVGEIEDEFLARSDAWMWMAREFADIHNRLLKTGVMAALGVYAFVKSEKAQAFLDGYRSGAGLPPDSPVLLARNDAMGGTARDCRYWRVVTLTRAHLHGESIKRVFEAAEDMLGNSNSIRLIKARAAKGVKAAATRRARGG